MYFAIPPSGALKYSAKTDSKKLTAIETRSRAKTLYVLPRVSPSDWRIPVELPNAIAGNRKESFATTSNKAALSNPKTVVNSTAADMSQLNACPATLSRAETDAPTTAAAIPKPIEVATRYSKKRVSRYDQ